MFSLIITIISIALVAALAVATIYYGGSAFTNGSAKAAASTVVAHAQQITGANTLYASDNNGSFAATLSALAPTYLASVPTPPANVSDYSITDNLFQAKGGNAAVCAALTTLAGGSGNMSNTVTGTTCAFTYQG